MDSPTSVRKELTASWDVPYKSNRKQKADALGYQLNLVQTLLSNRNADVVFVNGWEADDIMASYARQFDGKVSLWTVDKDMRQCLSPHVNILEDVEWERDEATNTMRPLYKWVNQEAHEEKGIVYQSDLVTGIKPERWPLFQAIAGDASDSIQGAKGIGPKGAMELLKNFASLDDILAAARDNHPAIAARQRKILLAWEPIAHDTLQLTTLRTDLTVPAVLQMNLLLEPHSTHSTTAAPPHDSELPQQPSPPDAGYDNWPADDRSE
jgi:DNA polymerase-1